MLVHHWISYHFSFIEEFNESYEFSPYQNKLKVNISFGDGEKEEGERIMRPPEANSWLKSKKLCSISSKIYS